MTPLKLDPTRRQALVLLGGAFVSMSGCNSSAESSSDEFPSPIEMAMQTWIGYGYAVVAKEKGFFGNMQVNMSIVEDGTALAGGLTGGSTQIIGSTLDQFVLQRSNNMPAQLLSLTDDSFGGDGLAVTSAIKTMADVRGKRIAYTPGPSSEYVLATALKRFGMSFDDVETVTFPDPSGTVAAFVNGRVDAACIFQPYLEQTLARPDSRLLFTTKEFPDISVGCFIIRDDLANVAKIAKRFAEGLARAEKFVAAKPSDADAIMQRFFNVDEAALQAMRQGARLKGIAENKKWLTAPGQGEAPVLGLLRDIEAHYRSRNVAGPRLITPADINPAAIKAFETL